MYKKPEYVFFTVTILFAVSVFFFYQVNLGPLLKESGANPDLAEAIVMDNNDTQPQINPALAPDEPIPDKIISPDRLAGPTLIKSVRLDLSSVAIPADFTNYAEEILGRLRKTGANAVYVSPWSDGRANYDSAIAPRNDFGQNKFLENFITLAEKNNIKVYAWFVVGKDNFPFFSRPEWFAKTPDGKNYYQEDEPGLQLPFASLANGDYLDYHLKLISEVNALPLSGWVISEPVIGWGDKYDDFYTDFSPAATDKFRKRSGMNAADLFNENSGYYHEDNDSIHNDWINFRAGIVTDFVAASMKEIRKKPDRSVIVTLFTEPDKTGRLIPLSDLKEWLGTDVPALIALKPDYLELQSLFADFEYPQKPAWTADMVKQFHSQLPSHSPLLVSVQGFNVAPNDFVAAMTSAMNADIKGVSFYAYHTLSDEHWRKLEDIW